MYYYFAPLEGISLAPLRRAHHACFPGIDKYFSPFLVANQTLHFHQKEIRDILPEHNREVPLVPQILTNRADQMLWALGELRGYGYHEINLNLGCPMPQVAKRGRGAGFLRDPEALDRFFEEVFEGLAGTDIRLSVKTRIGLEDEAEAWELARIYFRYPVEELIVHPRLQRELYSGTPHMEVFARILEESPHPVCYNGDLLTPEDVEALRARFPKLDRVMMGRGLLRNPALVCELRAAEEGGQRGETGPEQMLRYHDELFQSYLNLYPDSRQAVSKMKDIWSFWQGLYPGQEKQVKKLRKTIWPEEYEQQAHRILENT